MGTSRRTSHRCEAMKNPAACLTPPRGSYWLVEVSQSQFQETPAQLPKFKKECRSRSLGHSARLARPTPPLSHRGDAQRGTFLVATGARFGLAADSRGPKPEREVSRSADRFAIDDLEMFWITARLQGESHRREIAVFVPERFVSRSPHSPSPCRRTATTYRKHLGNTARHGLAAAEPVSRGRR